MSLKSEMICSICKLILKDPVSLPCSSAICDGHLRDDTAKNGTIRCLECDQEFDISQRGFPQHKMASNILVKKLHLSDEEKAIKQAIQETIQQLEQLQFDLKAKHSDLERISFDYFTELRRQIDIQREELKNKIDEIALKMIDQVNKKETDYISTMKQYLLAATPVDIEQCMQSLANEFRNPNLIIEEVKRIQNEQQQRVKQFQARIKEIESLFLEMEPLVFKPSTSFLDESFGILRSNGLIACALDKNIEIWNIVSNECLAILEGHSMNIRCLETIDENRFASGSLDNTIRIWDAKNFVCLKTLKGHLNGVLSLKSLTSTRIASGSFLAIKIWDIKTGKCLKTLRGHSSWIYGLVYLPNGNLASCSSDTSIKVWDLIRGECIQTITSYSEQFCCIVLLRNGQLASGSKEGAIKIWNTESGICVKTLKGHSNWVKRLVQLESGDLVSCSVDKTIKTWDLAEDICIRTLVGHTSSVKSIRINSRNNILVSCSLDGTLKTWNSKIGELFFSTVVDMNGSQFLDFIFI